jgi:hypothetical protein
MFTDLFMKYTPLDVGLTAQQFRDFFLIPVQKENVTLEEAQRIIEFCEKATDGKSHASFSLHFSLSFKCGVFYFF